MQIGKVVVVVINDPNSNNRGCNFVGRRSLPKIRINFYCHPKQTNAKDAVAIHESTTSMENHIVYLREREKGREREKERRFDARREEKARPFSVLKTRLVKNTLILVPTPYFRDIHGDHH